MSLWGNDTAVRFPNLGIEFNNLPRGFEVGSFRIAFYGLIIAIGMVAGIVFACKRAKKQGQNPDVYLDLALWAIPLCVIGARLYSVAFEWDYYKDNLSQIFNLRNGGLAIYGGIIVAFTTAVIYCRIRKYNFALVADTGVPSLILGQIIGRWGNFFNREAFGKFTDSIFAMQIDVTDGGLSSYFKPSYPAELVASAYEGKPDALANIMEIRNNVVTLADGHQYVQVQPTFLYESLWNVLILALMLFATKRKKFNGEIMLLYLSGYAFGRFFIEGLRTDQLFLWNSGLAVSQLLSAILFICSTTILLILRHRAIKNGTDWTEALATVSVFPDKRNGAGSKKKGSTAEKAVDEAVKTIIAAEEAEHRLESVEKESESTSEDEPKNPEKTESREIIDVSTGEKPQSSTDIIDNKDSISEAEKDLSE